MDLYLPFPPLYLTPYLPFKIAEAVFNNMAENFFTVPPEYRQRSATREISPEAIHWQSGIMQNVRLGRRSKATFAQALTDAKMSGDHNPIHVDPSKASARFGKKLISHGMRSVTQAAGALMSHRESRDLVPEHFDVQFRGAVILEEDTILPPTVKAGNSPLHRVIEVFAENSVGTKLVTKVTATMREGTFEEGELEYHLVCGWHISAALAKLHRGCVYYGQKHTFHKSPRPTKTYTHIRGIGRDGERVIVRTGSRAGGVLGEPLATGEATIILE